jgi:Big-like domain-containing protein
MSAIGCAGGDPVDPTPAGLVPVATLSVSSTHDTVYVADTLSLGLVVRDSAGNLLSGRAVQWQSSASGIATVSNVGLVTGVAPGAVTISASAGGQTGFVSLVVRRLVFSVNVVPDAVCLRKSFTTFLSITAYDSLDQPLPTGLRPITWRTTNGLIATVTPQGGDSARVLGVAPGSVFIIGTILGVADTTGFVVDPTPLGQPLQCGGAGG